MGNPQPRTLRILCEACPSTEVIIRGFTFLELKKVNPVADPPLPWYRRARGPLTKMHLPIFAARSGPPSVALARTTTTYLIRGHGPSLRRSKSSPRRPGFRYRVFDLSFPGPEFSRKPARNRPETGNLPYTMQSDFRGPGALPRVQNPLRS